MDSLSYDIQKVKIDNTKVKDVDQASTIIDESVIAKLDDIHQKSLSSITMMATVEKKKTTKRKFIDFADINHYSDPDSYEYREDTIFKLVTKPKKGTGMFTDYFTPILFNDGFRPRNAAEKKKVASLLDDMVKRNTSKSARERIDELKMELIDLHRPKNADDIVNNFDDLIDHMDEYEEMDLDFDVCMEKQEAYFRCIQSAYFRRVKENLEVGSVINAWFQYVKSIFPRFVADDVSFLSANQYISILIATDSSLALIMTLLFTLTNLTYSQIVKMKCMCCGADLMNVVPFKHNEKPTYNVLWNTCTYLSSGLCFQHYKGMTRKIYSEPDITVKDSFSTNVKVQINSPIVMKFNKREFLETSETVASESDCDNVTDILPISVKSDFILNDAQMYSFEDVNKALDLNNNNHLRCIDKWVKEAANLGARYGPMVALIKKSKVKYSPPVFSIKDVLKMMSNLSDFKVDPILLGLHSVGNNHTMTHEYSLKCHICKESLYKIDVFPKKMKQILSRPDFYKYFIDENLCLSCLQKYMNDKAPIGAFSLKINHFIKSIALGSNYPVNRYKLLYKEIIWDILSDDERTRYINYLLEDDPIKDLDTTYWDRDSALCTILYTINQNVKVVAPKESECLVCSKSIHEAVAEVDRSAIPKYYLYRDNFRSGLCLICKPAYGHYRSGILNTKDYPHLGVELFRQAIKNKEANKNGYKIKSKHAESIDVP